MTTNFNNSSWNKKSYKSDKLSHYGNPAISPSSTNAYNPSKIQNWNDGRFDGFTLPGINEQKDTFNQFVIIGCVNAKEHERKGFGNKNYAHKFKMTCGNPKCIACYEHWITREANRAKKRIKQHQENTRDKPIHVVLSPHKTEHRRTEKQLRKTAMKILHEVNVKDGALVFHPWRLDKKIQQMYLFPHFHFVGFGWIRNAQVVAEKYGWKILYKGIRKTLFGTFCYLLSHCGVKHRRHSVTWLGKLSYGQLRIKNKSEPQKCPACGKKLEYIWYDGADSGIPPDEEFEGFVDCEGWHPVKTDANWNMSEPNYEYDPRRVVDEYLRSISEAN